MSTVYVYRVNDEIVGISGSPQSAINAIDWVEKDADDPEVLQWMIDHQVRAPYTGDTIEGD
jgi:hypothetical protein